MISFSDDTALQSAITTMETTIDGIRLSVSTMNVQYGKLN